MSNLKIKAGYSACEKLFAVPDGTAITNNIRPDDCWFFHRKNHSPTPIEYYLKFSIMSMKKNE